MVDVPETVEKGVSDPLQRHLETKIPANFTQFIAIVSSFLGQPRRLLCKLFVAQYWASWHVHNKLTI
jgi:hypothetical protein